MSSEYETVFAREEVLFPEFLPEILPHRENHIQLIADNIKPAAFGRKPQNTFVFGVPGIGKCVSYDTPILMSDNRTITTKEFYEFALKFGHLKKVNNNEEFISLGIIPWQERKVISLNTKTGKVETAIVSYVYRQKYDGEMIKLTTDSGKIITLTPYHPLFTLNQNGTLEKIEAKNLKLRDFIITPRKIFPEKTRKYGPKIWKSRKEIILELEPYRILNKKIKIYPSEQFFLPRTKIDRNFSSWLGILQAEGYISDRVITMTNNDPFVRETFNQLTNSVFHIKSVSRKYGLKSPYCMIASKGFIKYLEVFSDGEFAGTNKEKTVPQRILSSPNEIVSEYLSWYFSLDGSIYNNLIEISNANLETINRINYLLLRFGILCRIKPKKVKNETYYRLLIEGKENIEVFHKFIGFKIKEKQHKLELALSKKTKESTNVDVIPNIGSLLKKLTEVIGSERSKKLGLLKNVSRYVKKTRNISRNYLQKIVNNLEDFEDNEIVKTLKIIAYSDIFCDRIKKIEIVKNEHGYVYDLNVPKNNTFVGGIGGVICHNTATAKYIFRQFEEFSERVKTIYINCWDYKTAHAVLSKIALDIGQFVQRRGMGKDEIIEKLAEACRRNKKSIIVALDEIDQLVFNNQEALYDLLRIGQYVDNPFGFIFISNHPDVFVKLEPRIKSSLNIDEVQFKTYSLEEMKDILQKRAELAFRNIEAGVIQLAAYHAVKKGGDVRAGLEILLKAGRIAEKENSKKVLASHVRKVVGEVERPKPKILKERISESERQLLEIVENKKELTAGELYEEYKSKFGELSERRVRELINHLEETGLIKSRKSLLGSKGNTRIIYI